MVFINTTTRTGCNTFIPYILWVQWHSFFFCSMTSRDGISLYWCVRIQVRLAQATMFSSTATVTVPAAVIVQHCFTI